MIKAYALQSIDTSISAVTYERSQLEELLEKDPLSGMCTIIEIEYNDTPLTEAGEKIKQDLVELMTKKGLVNFHVSLGPKFYEKTADERMQFMWDIFTMEGESFSFNDSNRAPQSNKPSVDLKDHLDEEGNLDVESLRATGAMICPVD